MKNCLTSDGYGTLMDGNGAWVPFLDGMQRVDLYLTPQAGRPPCQDHAERIEQEVPKGRIKNKINKNKKYMF